VRRHDRGDGSPSIRIRSVGTFRNSEPLVVLDGVPLPTTLPLRNVLTGLNPNLAACGALKGRAHFGQTPRAGLFSE